MWAEHLRTSLRGGLQHGAPRISRRHLLAGTAAVVLASCSKKTQRDQLSPIAADDRKPGEPLWSALTNSFVVAVTPDGRKELAAMGSSYLALGSSGLIALANECTFAKSHIGRLAWCRPPGLFICLECASRWTQFGTVITGPATQGLTFLTVSVSDNDDVLIDRRSRTPGPLAIPEDPNKADMACDQTFASPA